MPQFVASQAVSKWLSKWLSEQMAHWLPGSMLKWSISFWHFLLTAFPSQWLTKKKSALYVCMILLASILVYEYEMECNKCVCCYWQLWWLWFIRYRGSIKIYVWWVKQQMNRIFSYTFSLFLSFLSLSSLCWIT